MDEIKEQIKRISNEVKVFHTTVLAHIRSFESRLEDTVDNPTFWYWSAETDDLRSDLEMLKERVKKLEKGEK